jgi:hypothetical protein
MAGDFINTATVWPVWVAYSSTSNCTATSVPYVWDEWCCNSTATTSNYVNVWPGWVMLRGGTGTAYAQYVPPAKTPEQIEAERRSAEEWQKRAEEEKRKREAAEQRAEELLTQLLDQQQREERKKDGSFRVVGRDGHHYRVRKAWSGHVDRLDEKGNPVERYCVHPSESVPIADNQTIAKLALETDPDSYRRRANVTPMRMAV